VSAATLAYGNRREPALGPSLALSVLAHTILIAVLFLGVRFQSHAPETVQVELWEPPPPPPPAPVVEAPKPPPPPPVVKPEPEPVIKKPDIALAEKPKPKPKPEPKVEPKPKPVPKRDPAFDKMLREQAALEQKQLDEQRRERELKDLIAKQQAAAQAAAQAATQKALASWSDKIRAKVRGNIILPQDLPGNPEAIFDVALLPTGEVLTVRKRKSSGHPGYDEAVERAIMKSSPLPLPDERSVFRRDLELKFRPHDR
jgi:colicin import membrane protein